MSDLDDIQQDPPYLVPGHLKEGQSVGIIPARLLAFLMFGLLIGGVLGVAVYNATGGRYGATTPLPRVLEQLVADAAQPPAPLLAPPVLPTGDRALALLAILLVELITVPLGLPVWEPKPEHGLFMLVRHLVRRRTLKRVPEIDALRVDGDVLHTIWGPRAVYRAPTLNLSSASSGTRRQARARWGAIINALPHPVQIVIRAQPATTNVERIRDHGAPAALRLAAWLVAHLKGASLVSRTRFVVLPADDVETLADRCTTFDASMRRMGLSLERLGGRDLGDAVHSLLTPRPLSPRLGPPVIEVGATRLAIDGQLVQAYCIGQLPPTIVTDWAAPLFDGEQVLDVSIDIDPLDLSWAKHKLDMRRNALESSKLTPGRMVALEQISGLRMAYERRSTLPQNLTVTVLLRGASRAQLDAQGRRLQQRCRELGATLRLLRWEQRGGWLGVAPMRRPPLVGRSLSVESGTVARTYPFSAATLTVTDGVPFGVAGNSPVTFSVAVPRRAGRKGWRHMVWYGAPGSGKGYQLKVYLAREHFANGLRVYGIDQDEQGEYAGRFCSYLNGWRVPIKTVAEAQAVELVYDDDVVIFDLHQSEEQDRGKIFAILKREIVRHLLATKRLKRRAALIVDEAVTVADDEDGARALGDLNRRGRHFGVEMHVLTQRVTDWFGTQIGRTIQGTSANQWFGQMEATELSEFAPRLNLSAEECELIERAGQGEGLLVTNGQRVWVNLYGHTSPDEFEAFNTDFDEVDDDDTEDLEERTNGHVPTFAAVH